MMRLSATFVLIYKCTVGGTWMGKGTVDGWMKVKMFNIEGRGMGEKSKFSVSYVVNGIARVFWS